jgi:hypothetical protein
VTVLGAAIASESLAHRIFDWYGWEALVAIGTLSLATFTGWLAWTTRKVALADLADLRAQWRPMLVPTGGPMFGADEETGQWKATVPIRNAGRGPALYVRATLEPPNVSPDHWSLGSISPEDQPRELTFSNLPNRDVRYQLLLDYRDLGGRIYSTQIVIDFPQAQDADPRMSPGRVYDVHLFEDTSITHLGDSVPRRKACGTSAPRPDGVSCAGSPMQRSRARVPPATPCGSNSARRTRRV